MRFTEHARRKLELLRTLGVTEDAVLKALMEPDELLYDTQRSRLIAVRYDQGLAVPFDQEGDVITVVTVLYSSGLRKLVERRKKVREMDMSVLIEYDPEADILLVRLRPGEPRDEKLLDSDVVLGIGERGEILYIEVWDASKRGLARALTALTRAKQEKVHRYLEATGAKQRAVQPTR